MLRKTIFALIVIVSALVICYTFYNFFIGSIASPSFKVTASFETLSIHYLNGSMNSTVISLKSINGFEGVISLELQKSFGMSPSLDVLLEPEEVSLTPDETVQTSLTLIARYNIPKEQYIVDVICRGNGIQRTVRININVE